MARGIIKPFEATQKPAPWIGRNIIQNVKDRQRKAQAVNVVKK